MALYDRDERREVDDPGTRREVAEGVVRQIDLIGNSSMVIYSDLSSKDVDAAIRREASYFSDLGHDVEWKVYSHDRPVDLHERLLAQGFVTEEPDAIMVLDLHEVPKALLQPPVAPVKKVTDESMLADLAWVNDAVWPEKTARFQERLGRLLRTDPDRLSIYVAYVGDEPASAARIHFSARSSFASIWGGATVPGHRGKGLYTQLLAVRIQEAIRRGARFVTIDAGPMSRPIVEQHGFRLLAYAQAHVREAASA